MSHPHAPTDITKAEVAALLSFGNTHQQICEYIGITDKTFVKHYDHEIRTASIKANANVAKRLYNKAVAQDDLQAQIFWLKTRARWRTVDIEDKTAVDPALLADVVKRVNDINKEAEKDF